MPAPDLTAWRRKLLALLRAAPAAAPVSATLAILASSVRAAPQAGRHDSGAWRDPAVALDDAQWQALLPATDVTRELAAGAVAALLPRLPATPVLHLLPLLPGGWELAQRRACGQWLKHIVAKAGWPASHIALAAELPADARGASPAAVLRRLAYHGVLSGLPLAGLVVAAADDGAAGLLLTDLHQAEAVLGAPHVALDPAASVSHAGGALPFMVALALLQPAAASPSFTPASTRQ